MPQTLAAPPATTSAVAMPNALSEYRAPLKPLSSSTLDKRKDASPEGGRKRPPAFANGSVFTEASSIIREDRGTAEGPAPLRCGARGARLLTGGAEFIFDVSVSKEEGFPPPPMIELDARCLRRRSAMGKARAAVVMASWGAEVEGAY